MAACQQTSGVFHIRAVAALVWTAAALSLLAACAAADTATVTVQLSLGLLRGTRRRFEGRTYHAFLGVPYAETPLLFEEAVMKRPWKGVLEAVGDAASCLQRDPYMEPGDYTGSADCLFLNVYTPAVNGERGLPVIVFLHGGGYSSGHAGSEWVNPQYFMAQGVVVVTVAYRLGAFGFLCTGDHQALANVGLRDQRLALRWVRTHAAAFGGARDRVTLMGHDAGAASVHLHMVAPASRGLFARAISQSGVWLSWWLGAQQPQQAAAAAAALAAMLGCQWGRALLPCLRNRPLRALLNATAQFQFWSVEPLSVFRPCVDAVSDSPFLPVDPLEALQQGKVVDVPWLLGVTSGQGLFRLTDIFSSRSATARMQLERDFNEIMPTVLGLNVSFPSYKVKQAWLQIQLLYYGKSKVNPFEDAGRTLSNLYADRFFLHGWRKAIIYHHRFARADNIYAYVFNYSGSRSFQSYYGHGEHLSGRPFATGACHGDDLLHLFEMPKLFPPATDSDKETIRAMVNLWANFARDGYPVARRQPVADDPPCWRADTPTSALAAWPAATEDEPWFAEFRGGQRRGGRLRVCPSRQLAGAEARLSAWDALPMAENLDLSLAAAYRHAAANRRPQPLYDGDDDDQRLRRAAAQPCLRKSPFSLYSACVTFCVAFLLYS